METYDVRANRWFTHPQLEDVTPRAYHGVVTLNKLVYVIGGFDGLHYYSSVKCFWFDDIHVFCSNESY